MEYEPLFPPGFHNITIDQLEKIFSIPFENSKVRKNYVVRLEYFLNKLEAIGISFEVWIDGSFATKKVNPADIDSRFPLQVSQAPSRC